MKLGNCSSRASSTTNKKHPEPPLLIVLWRAQMMADHYASLLITIRFENFRSTRAEVGTLECLGLEMMGLENGFRCHVGRAFQKMENARALIRIFNQSNGRSGWRRTNSNINQHDSFKYSEIL
jgi:hypothetical protein